MGSVKIDKTTTRGRLNIVLCDANGREKDRREVNNLIVDVGLQYIVNRMVDANKPVMSHMAVGSDDDLTNAAEFTDLGSTLGSRKALTTVTLKNSGASTQNDAIEYDAAFFAGESTGAVVEAGIFNDGTIGQGDMLARTTFPVVNKGVDDILAISWTITLEPEVSSSGA